MSGSISALIPLVVAVCVSPATDSSGNAPFAEWRLDSGRVGAMALSRNLTSRLERPRGDSESPALTIGGWDGGGSFSVTFDSSDSAPSDVFVRSAGTKSSVATVVARSCTHHVFVRDDGALEWNIVLATPPPAGRLAFGLRSHGVRFLYQGRLSAADSAEGAERPDSVVGSYAVYYAGKMPREPGPGNPARIFGTGKVCHIYRPKAWDSAGDTVWCEIAVDTVTHLLIVSAPESFLMSARYPVTIDPTFGCTEVGASNISLATDAACANIVDVYEASAADRIVTYHFSCYTYNNPRTVDMAAYEMSSGDPDQRLAAPVTIAVQNSAPAQWYVSSVVSHSMIGGRTYCIAVGGVSGSSVRAQYDTDIGARSDDASGGGTLAQTWSVTDHQDRRMSWYVTYETDDGGQAYAGRRRRLGQP